MLDLIRARLKPPWAMVVAYAALIFWGSSRTWAVPGAGWADLSPIYHVVEYAILAFLVLRALRSVGVPLARARILAAAVALAYGGTDEIHQMFVPGRVPSALDLVADGLGAWIAVWGAGRRRGRPATRGPFPSGRP